MTTEFALNPDGYRLSTHIYKRRDSVDPHFKVTPWDFNMCFGNNIGESILHDGWMYKIGETFATMGRPPVPFCWDRLTEDEAYLNRMKERWAEYRLSNYSDEHVTAVIDSLVNELNVAGACERNYEAWPIWDKEIPLAPTTATNYSEEIAHLREWITERVAWMDNQLEFDPNIITGSISSHHAQSVSHKENDFWYDLQGRRYVNMPTGKGVYIYQGKKRVI